MLKIVRIRPGLSARRPTRDVAWIYSDVILGCENTAINPSRGISRPTEIMFVASATSTAPDSWNGRLSASLAAATLSVP